MEELLQKCGKDKYGYYQLDSIADKIKYDRNRDIYVINLDDIRFYYKNTKMIKKKGIFDKIFPKLADNDYSMIVEIVNSKVQRRLGANVADYHLVKHNNCRGVVSSDVSQSYNGAKTIAECLNITVNYERYSVEELKSYFLSLRSSKNFKKEIEMIPFVHATTGQTDGHIQNIMAYVNNKREFQGLIYLDNADSSISDFSYYNKKKMKEEYKNGQIPLPMGIATKSDTLEDFYKDIFNCPSIISDATITTYLSRMEKMLHNDSCLLDINAEVIEEYNMPIPKDYYNRLKFVMESVAEGVESSFDMRKKGNIDKAFEL